MPNPPGEAQQDQRQAEREKARFECVQFNGVWMCAFQKEGPREPCAQCPSNPANLRSRLDAVEGELERAEASILLAHETFMKTAERANRAEKERDEARRQRDAMEGKLLNEREAANARADQAEKERDRYKRIWEDEGRARERAEKEAETASNNCMAALARADMNASAADRAFLATHRPADGSPDPPNGEA